MSEFKKSLREAVEGTIPFLVNTRVPVERGEGTKRAIDAVENGHIWPVGDLYNHVGKEKGASWSVILKDYHTGRLYGGSLLLIREGEIVAVKAASEIEFGVTSSWAKCITLGELMRRVHWAANPVVIPGASRYGVCRVEVSGEMSPKGIRTMSLWRRGYPPISVSVRSTLDGSGLRLEDTDDRALPWVRDLIDGFYRSTAQRLVERGNWEASKIRLATGQYRIANRIDPARWDEPARVILIDRVSLQRIKGKIKFDPEERVWNSVDPYSELEESIVSGWLLQRRWQTVAINLRLDPDEVE